MQRDHSIDEALARLCEILEDEAERQENVLSVCRAHQAAALGSDTEELEKRTAALGALIREAANAEEERLRVVKEVVERFALQPERQTMSHLIRVAPRPWQERMRDAQRRLQVAMKTSRGLTRSTGRALRASIDAVGRCMSGLDASVNGTNGQYGAGGQVKGSTYRRPALVDQKG